MLEALEVARIAVQGVFGGVVRKVSRLLRKRLFQGEKFRELTRRRFPHARRATEIAMLLEQRDAQPRLPGNHTACRLHLASQQPKERRLTGAVPSDDAPALSRGHR